MARAELVKALVRSHYLKQNRIFSLTVNTIITEARTKNHHNLAEHLESILEVHADNQTTAPYMHLHRDQDLCKLVHIINPKKTLSDLILSDDIVNPCLELLEEHKQAELLREHNIEPRNRIMLSGPPGNGKTSLAEAIATALGYPLLVIKYEAVVNSYLGETAKKISQVFEKIKQHRVVCFFDEFDVLASSRDSGAHENTSGEVHRATSTLLLQMDSMPSNVIMVTATNLNKQIDKAAKRRLQLHLTLEGPNPLQVEEWFERFLKTFEEAKDTLPVPLYYLNKPLQVLQNRVSFADLEQFCLDVKRRYILTPEGARDLKGIIDQRVVQWQGRLKSTKKED